MRICASDRTLWTTLTALDYDAILLADVQPGVKELMRALGEDARLRSVPTVVLVPPGAPHASHAESEPGVVVLEGAAPQRTAAAIAALVDRPPPQSSSAGLSSVPSAPSIPPASDSSARRELEQSFHDLRVLLGIVVGFGSNLRDGADGPVTDNQQAQLQRIIEAASDARELLDRSVAATRRAALGITGPNAPGGHRALVDVAAVAESTVRLLGRAAAQRGIDLQLSTGGPLTVWGYSAHLKQVVTNLVANAIKFVPAGARVRVLTRLASPTHAEIVVSDTGPGVPPADRERIFGHGARLARDAGVTGAGIGLAVVRELVVVHHGGTVRVVDAPGGGAEFIVTLPLDRRKRSRGVQPSSADEPTRTGEAS